MGFIISEALRPSYYYGRRHDYVYYPESWTDQSTGTYYEKGYYDENGQHYDSVTFQENGKYENVVCHCPYCGQDTVLNLTAGDAASHNLQCPHCGGPMKIQSELDDYVTQPAANTHTYASEESLRQFQEEAQKKKKAKRRRRWLIVLAVLVVLYLYGHSLDSGSQPDSYEPQSQQLQLSQPDTVELGDTVVLVRTGDSSFQISSADAGDKTLIWDWDADSYYDADTDCWLWYNTDVEPALWQYWYEGISSEYEESGWMEHDETGWYIEAREGTWISLPETFDTSELWYIE